LIPTAAAPAVEVDPLIAYGSRRELARAHVGYTVYLGLDPVDTPCTKPCSTPRGFRRSGCIQSPGVAVRSRRDPRRLRYAGLALAVAGENLSLDAQLTGGISGYDGVRWGLQDVTAQAIGSASIAGSLYASLVGGLGLGCALLTPTPTRAALGVAF
jgi:hypothetical protein